MFGVFGGVRVCFGVFGGVGRGRVCVFGCLSVFGGV